MEIIIIPQDRQAKLFMALEKNLSSIRKRNISYTITTYSDVNATVAIQVNGRKGMVTKNIAINYDSLLLSWTVYAVDKKYILDSLTELGTIVKSLIQRVSNTVVKI